MNNLITLKAEARDKNDPYLLKIQKEFGQFGNSVYAPRAYLIKQFTKLGKVWQTKDGKNRIYFEIDKMLELSTKLTIAEKEKLSLAIDKFYFENSDFTLNVKKGRTFSCKKSLITSFMQEFSDFVRKLEKNDITVENDEFSINI